MFTSIAAIVIGVAVFAGVVGGARPGYARSVNPAQLTPEPFLPMPQVSTISVWVDRGTGGTYYVGDPIRICITVPGPGSAYPYSQATVRLTDILPNGVSQVTFNERVSGQRCIQSFITPPLGRETLRADVLDDVVCIMAPCPPIVAGTAQTYFYVVGDPGPWAPPPPWPPFPPPPTQTPVRPIPTPTALPSPTATLVPTSTAVPPTPPLPDAPPPAATLPAATLILSGALCGFVDCAAANATLEAVAPRLLPEETYRLQLHFQTAEAALGLYGPDSDELAGAMERLRAEVAILAEQVPALGALWELLGP